MEEHSQALAAIAVFGAIALAGFLPSALRIALLPAVVLEIVFGAAIGPQGLGWAEMTPLLDTFAELGLALLFLIAGFEIDPSEVRGAPTRLAVRGWVVSLVIALVLCGAAAWFYGLPAPGYVALAVTTTAIGALMPILKDRGFLGGVYGPFVLAAGTSGEALPLIALSLLLAGAAGFGAQGVILVVFALIAAGAVWLASLMRTERMSALLHRTIDSSGQFPIRAAIFLLVVFVLIGESFGLDLVLGAFVAGAVARSLMPVSVHHDVMQRLSAIGYGFLVPIFFVTSGMELDLRAVVETPAALTAIPAFALLMLVVRGLPALILYRRVLPVRERIALALHTGTQLPLVVAISALAVNAGEMPGWIGASLVTAAVLTVVVYPALAALAMPAPGSGHRARVDEPPPPGPANGTSADAT